MHGARARLVNGGGRRRLTIRKKPRTPIISRKTPPAVRYETHEKTAMSGTSSRVILGLTFAGVKARAPFARGMRRAGEDDIEVGDEQRDERDELHHVW